LRNSVVNFRIISFAKNNWFKGLIIIAILSKIFDENLSAQEALRQSLAGDISAETFQRAESTLGYYNLLLGPTAWRFSSALEMDYDSNVRLQSQGAESDVIFRPNTTTQMHWPITLKNSLDFSLGVGYSAYAVHSDLDQFFITPGSGFLFNIYIGDCVINLHDRISITENSYENPGAISTTNNVHGNANGNGNLISLQNTIGISALWDLNKIIANAGYDHVNYVSLSNGNGSQQPDSSSDNFFANAGVHVVPEVLLGLEVGGGFINYAQTGTNQFNVILAEPDAAQWNAGAFVSAQISQYISTRLDAGYTEYLPDSTSTNFFSSKGSGFYFQFSLTHQLNQHINYSLSAGRSTDFSSYGQLQQYYFVRLQPNWNFLHKYQLSTPISWQHGTQLANQTYDQFSIGILLGRQLTRKLSGGLSYQFIKESSNQTSLSYLVNIVSLNLSYQF
jgi:hypothetical protein